MSYRPPTFRTNKNKKKYPIYDVNNPSDRIQQHEEELVPATSVDAPDDFYTCAICLEKKRKSETPYVMNPSGSPACQDCLRDAKSGRIEAEAYERARQYTAPVVDSSSGDGRHTHKGTCSGCGSTRRSLCPQHSLCFNCDKPGCPRSH